MFPIPANEHARLAALRELAILDTPPEQLYDDIVRLAAAICHTPIAIINFVDADRQWGKALIGLDSSEAPRDASFCARTIVQEDGLMVVPDTLKDALWAENPQVLGDPRLRFYAGASIVSDEGHALGSVCVADRGPRDIDDQALDALRVLARQTAAHLKLRKQSMQLAHANEQLRSMAVKDILTGLANRTLLRESLSLALRQRRRSRRALGVLFCDLDRFKAVNDRLGHHAGDQLLRTVADRMTATARTSDLVARLAGDEFVVMCPDLGADHDLDTIAQRLSRAVSRPVTIAGTLITPKSSIGKAVARDSDNVEDLLRRADKDMYRSKRVGRAGPPRAKAAR